MNLHLFLFKQYRIRSKHLEESELSDFLSFFLGFVCFRQKESFMSDAYAGSAVFIMGTNVAK